MPPDLAPDTLAAATALTPVSPTRFRARLSADWLGGTGVPFGGYSASLALRAIREAMPGYPDAIAFTLDLFGAPEGPVEIEVSVLKKGKSFGTASATLFELKDGSWEAWGAAQATLGALPAEPAKYEVPEWYSKKPANVPEGDESMDGFEVYNRAGWGLGPPYTDRFEFRVSKMHYEDIRRQIRDARTMNENDPRRLDIGKDLELWVGLRDDPAAMDPLALTVWADMTGAIVRSSLSPSHFK